MVYDTYVPETRKWLVEEVEELVPITQLMKLPMLFTDWLTLCSRNRWCYHSLHHDLSAWMIS